MVDPDTTNTIKNPYTNYGDTVRSISNVIGTEGTKSIAGRRRSSKKHPTTRRRRSSKSRKSRSIRRR